VAVRQEQVPKSIQVQLHHVAFELDIVVGHRLEDFKHLDNRTWGQTRHIRTSLNREGLTRACLTISENNNIETVNRRLDKAFSVIKDLLLCALRPKHGVKVVFLHTVFLGSDSHLSFVLDRDTWLHLVSISLLGVRKGSDTAVHANLTLHILEFIEQLLPLDLFLLILGRHNVKLSSSFFQMLLQQSRFFFQGLRLTSSSGELLDPRLELIILSKCLRNLVL